jgi:SAM-dependent methyltransferase
LKVKEHIPWPVKFAAKIVMSRLPLDYQAWKKAGLFDLGEMQHPEYALEIFQRHFTSANFEKKNQAFIALELGPGDSLFSGLIARTFGAAHTYLVDIGPFASVSLDDCRRMTAHLRSVGLQPPAVETCSTLDELQARCGIEYLTGGLNSLRAIPTASVDFVWSHAVLSHIRRDDLMSTLLELRRIQSPSGIAAHHTGFGSVLGGGMNDLRFSERVWESSFIANSGFYTNRIHYHELMRFFAIAGFTPQVVRSTHWATLPLKRRQMAAPFANLGDDELQLATIDVQLR